MPSPTKPHQFFLNEELAARPPLSPNSTQTKGTASKAVPFYARLQEDHKLLPRLRDIRTQHLLGARCRLCGNSRFLFQPSLRPLRLQMVFRQPRFQN